MRRCSRRIEANTMGDMPGHLDKSGEDDAEKFAIPTPGELRGTSYDLS